MSRDITARTGTTVSGRSRRWKGTNDLVCLLKSTHGSYSQIILNFDFYITDLTETNSVSQMDYADHEKVIPKLISILYQKILPLTKVNKRERTQVNIFSRI